MTEKAFNGSTNYTPEDDHKNTKSVINRAMLLCLDKSGSMAGAPFTAL
jgi:uncharacterized protein with von Willebrand factor type A (vWA) domain